MRFWKTCCVALSFMAIVCAGSWFVQWRRTVEQQLEQQASEIETLSDFRGLLIQDVVGSYAPTGEWAGRECYQRGIWYVFWTEDRWNIGLSPGSAPLWYRERGPVGVYEPEERNGGAGALYMHKANDHLVLSR